MFLLRKKLQKIPLIAILVLIGIIINWSKIFKSYDDLCSYIDPNNDITIDCTFYILNVNNLIRPKLEEIIEVIPASLVMTVILIFEQFLYLE
jgi:predicted Co/Zn/Cd cation transporter (cation efflux family)